jgi:hypothetical protein
VNSFTPVHSSGVAAQRPLVALKHQPHPLTGVHAPHVVNWLHASPEEYPPPESPLSSLQAARATATAEASSAGPRKRTMERVMACSL